METSNEQNQNALEANIEVLQKGPEGIGGWLIFVLIGLVITPIRLVIIVFSDMIPLISEQTISLANYHGLTSLIYMEIIVNLLYASFSIFLLFYIFTKHKLFPLIIIIFFLSNFFFIILDLIFAYQIPVVQQSGMDASTMKELIRSLFCAVVWVPYFIVSKRVKNTFIR